MLAHVVSWEIDGGPGSVSEEQMFKILFSDEENKEYYSVGVENGHFIRDAANQFRIHLANKSAKQPNLLAPLDKLSDLKLLENEMVEFM
eukprot:2360514-Amphidinium_carterae.1